MRAEIYNITNCLHGYDKKWSEIVKNIIKENAELRSQNRKLKKKITTFRSSGTLSVLGAIDTNRVLP